MEEWSYRIDEENRVVEVCARWDEFAMANDSPGACSDAVTGRPVFDFVDGVSTRRLLHTLLDSVREEGEAVEIPFRCDSPDERRFMSWSGRLMPDGTVEITTRLLGTGARDTADTVDPDRPRGDGPVRMCSWCNRFAAGPGVWVEPETASKRLGLFVDRHVPEITHGICARCRLVVEGNAASD